MSDEFTSQVDQLSRSAFIRLIDGAGAGAVALLEGARALPQEWRPKLVEIANRLATRFPEAKFRSGNAPGSDEAFSWGVHQVDPERFEYVVPYATHRKGNRNPVSYSAAIDDVSLTSTAIPEPSAALLSLLGGALFLFRRSRKADR